MSSAGFARRSSVALLAALVLVFTACKKDKGGEGASSSAPEAKAAVEGPLAYFPADRSVVAGINVGQLASTDLFKTYQPKLEEDAEYKKFKEMCQMDITNAAPQVWIGVGPKGAEEEKMLVFVKTGHPKVKINECVTKVAKADGKDVSITEEGKITVYKSGEDTTYVAWLGDDQALINGDATGKAYLEEVLTKKTSVKDNAPVMDLIKNVDMSSTVWAVGTSMGEGSPMPMEGAEAFFMHLKYVKSLDLKFGVRHATPEAAKASADKMNAQVTEMKGSPQAAMFGKYIETLKIEPKDKDMIVTLSLDEQKLKELVEQMQGLLPMMMGGGGF